jgi:hypothetical protein
MQSDGLKGNFINSIIPDNNSRLWISTTTGLNIIDTKMHNIIQTDIDLSFSGNDFVANGIMRKNKKLLFFAGNKIVEIDPSSYYKSTDPNQILFADFKIFDKEKYLPVDSLDKMSVDLSYRQNFFSVGYSLLKSNPNSFTQYAYQLKGFDKDLNYVRERRVAYYTNVPPGKYVFQVKATDENGNWVYLSKSLSITVAPPLWLRWWFIMGIGVLIITGLYLLYRFRLSQIKKIFHLREKISRDLHDDIGASLSSIHIYSSVAEKTMDEDSEKSRTILRQINHNTQKVMENISDIVWAMNAKQSEEKSFSNRIKDYGYDLLSQKNIECNYQIDVHAEKKLQKPEARKNILLIVKEAMNNIAKYSCATQAAVHITTDDKNILIKITDNGKGFESNNIQKGNGLNNMQQRSSMLGGSCKFISSPGNGTMIQCSIPLTNISDR